MTTRLGRTVVIVLLMFFFAAESRAVSLGFSPTPLSVVEGERFSVDLAVSGLGDSMSLGGFDLNILYDPSVLSFRDVTYGDPLIGDQLAAAYLEGKTLTTAGPGIVKLSELSLEIPVILDLLQADSFVLATLSFNALGAGTTSLRISDELLSDAWGGSLDAEVLTGDINVDAQPVPEPGSCLLVATGLVGLAGIRLRRKRIPE